MEESESFIKYPQKELISARLCRFYFQVKEGIATHDYTKIIFFILFPYYCEACTSTYRIDTSCVNRLIEGGEMWDYACRIYLDTTAIAKE